MSNEPLASKIRPEKLDDFVGQDHLVGEAKPLRVAIEMKHKFSFILWGPPGSGKTTLARIYSSALDGELFELSAVSAGKADIKKIIDTDTKNDRILFLDEIHRFNKAQQDYLLPFVENGKIILIGATTENPSFEVIGPLLSRCKVFTLNRLSEKDLEEVIKRTKAKVGKKEKDLLIGLSNGDARYLISVVESTLDLYGRISEEAIREVVQNGRIHYDRKGDEHFNTISAYIKSMRAGQTDAALYYLARMIEGGEDPKFIARRMVIFASEDIGQALPTSLVVANEVFNAVEKVGLPEAEINLAHGTVYLSRAPKDRSSYDAYRRAQADAKRYKNLQIPMFVRNAPTDLMKDQGYGENYQKYTKRSMLPEKLKGKIYYRDKKHEEKREDDNEK